MLNANGIIVMEGKIFRVNLLSSLLIMDTDAYAANLMNHLEVLARDDEKAGDFDMAIAERVRAREINEWLKTHQRVVHSLPHLAMRQLLMPHVIGKSDISAYLREIIKLSEPVPAVEQTQIDFIVCMDGSFPMLLAKPRLRTVFAARGKYLAGMLSDDGNGIFAACVAGRSDEELYPLIRWHFDQSNCM
jgi:hypothetical protein